MKTARKLFCILTAWFVTFAVLIGALVLAWYLRGRPYTAVGYRFYPFSREVCEVQLTVDGRAVPLTADMVSPGICDGGTENTVSAVEQTPDGGVISCRGGEYGRQPFFITVPIEGREPAVFTVEPIVANDWEITKIRLTLSVDSKENKYAVQYHYEVYHDEADGEEAQEIGTENIIRINSI